MGDPEEHGTADRGVQLYDTEAVRDILSGLSLEGSTSGDSVQSRDEKTAAITENLAVSERMFCSFCDTPFNDRRQQKSHYKSDWHRFNLKQRLKCQPTLSEEMFEQTMEDVSSISGSGTDTNSSSSESESDSSCSKKEKVKLSRREVDREDGSDPEVDGTMEGMGRLNPWVFFRNKQDELVSIHRVILQNKKAPVQTAQELVKLATALPGHLKWAVLMAGGGHFAAALFHGAQVMAHKTFHRYVVRAKRGSAQSTRDGQGNAPKSGGASLRRYNEAALMQEIQELLRNWADRLRECDYIFLRAPSFNRSIFFGGRDAPLRKNDLRIRTIPFQTRRPTFHEVQRIHRLLATVRCHGCTTSLPRPVRLSPKKVTRDNIPQQSETAVTVDQKDCAEAVITSESSFGTIVMETPPGDQESSSDTEIQFSMETFDTLHLKQYDCCSRKPRRQRGKGGNNSRKMGEKQEEDPAMDESSRQLRNQLYTACKSCDLHSLHQLLEELTHQSGSTELIDLVEQQNINCSPADDAEEQQKMECSEKVRCSVVQNSEGARSGNLENTQKTEGDFSTITTDILNKPFGDGQRTLLHVTAEAGSSEMVSLLLRVGADPTLKDKLGRTPYTVASNKPTRNEFRKFRTEFPDRYNYGEAQIPEAISQEQEEKRKDRESARKRAQRKAKKERLKDQKAEEAKKEEVTRETDRFLALSDREKRALMAERRLLGQMSTLGDTSVILSRCWQCGVDISGKVPFEYLDFRFCSPRCLKQHRTINKTR